MKLKVIYDKMFFEGRVINPNTFKETDPIMDTDVIRVYHGFSNYSSDYAKIFARHGFSGKGRANRTYSYEYVNNPRGLFVTIDPHVAMEQFGSSGFVIEFHAKVSDLEAPVWNSDNGGYFVQGQYTKGFDNDDDREARKLADREKYRKSTFAPVAKSDRPELAFWILDGGERQALFVGDLNANMIKAFWVNDKLVKQQRRGDPWVRMSRNEFIKKYPIEKQMYVGKGKPEYSQEYEDAKSKLFKPTDDFSMDVLMNNFKNSFSDEESLLDAIMDDTNVLKQYLYPKQLAQFTAKYGEGRRR